MSWLIGIDSGGTFTDVCLFNSDTGEINIWKVSSTPDDPSRAIIQGATESAEVHGVELSDVSYFGHGTTVGTNALIEHRGVSTGLLTTQGFRDLLEIGRQKRPDLYDLQVEKPKVLVPRDLRLEVSERVRFTGEIDVPLDVDEVRKAAAHLRTQDVQSVAICLLYGFVNSKHEETVKRIVQSELPSVYVTASHEIAPEFREYERLSTTVVNSYLGPIMRRYIELLEARLIEAGIAVPPKLTQSNGGTISFDVAARQPVRTILSGPSTGVVAAQVIAETAGIDDLITFDMGGTSSDVALMQGRQCRMSYEATIHGYPIKAPMLDIHTVGAGGGSIAYVDNGGFLKVGPRSAGAMPGPVCYGNGGSEPTVTDANVVLHTLNPEHILGGRITVRQDLAEKSIKKLSTMLGIGLMETAQGILTVVTANMAKAIRVVSVQRGHDPRNFTLVAFGGAGPLHAARLMRELGMSQAMIPATPGVLCALGLLLSDLKVDFATSRRMPLTRETIGDVSQVFDELEAQAQSWFKTEGIAPERRQTRRIVDMRYANQNYELPIELPTDAMATELFDLLENAFTDSHSRQYGFIAPEGRIEMATFRLQAVGEVTKAGFNRHPLSVADPSAAIVCHRNIWFPETGGWTLCPVYSRERLKSGNTITGPAIIEQMDTTTVVLPDMFAEVDPYLNIILKAS